jgi:hypothetical protein
LIGGDDGWLISPLDSLEFSGHRSSGDYCALSDVVDFPGKDIAASGSAEVMLGATDALQHSIDCAWTVQLVDAPNGADIYAKLEA